MKARGALREIAALSASQWGMVTSAQAAERGVTRLNLSRLAESGDLVRLAHGVYQDAGAPTGAYADLRAAWLSTEPARLAGDRLKEGPRGVVVSGESAASLHDIGDLRANRHEFTSPVRRQTQRADIGYRRRDLTEKDVTIREGLPVTTLERTIADLVGARTDLSIVGNALRDASGQARLDLDYLIDLLSPLANAQGFGKGNGHGLLDHLLEIAGLDPQSVAQSIASAPEIGALVATKYLMQAPTVDLASLVDTSALAAPLQAAVDEQLEPLRDALRGMVAVQIPKYKRLGPTSKVLEELAKQPIAQTLDTTRAEHLTQPKTIDWAVLAATIPPRHRAEPEAAARES